MSQEEEAERVRLTKEAAEQERQHLAEEVTFNLIILISQTKLINVNYKYLIY